MSDGIFKKLSDEQKRQWAEGVFKRGREASENEARRYRGPEQIQTITELTAEQKDDERNMHLAMILRDEHLRRQEKKKGMTAPTLSMAAVRKKLREMRREINETLDLVEARLRRRSPTRRAKITSARMTPALAAEIRAMAAANPEMAMHEIAQAVKVNVGRVSEVLGRPADQPATVPQQPGLPVVEHQPKEDAA